VVIDPRLNWLAGKAKYWLPVRPGTDGALAMAIAGVIIKEELYDKKFIDLWTYGFEEYAAAVQVMTPEKAAEICWLDADLIRDAARFIATAKPMALQWGLKFDQQVDGTPLGQTALGIVAMTGNIDVPGGSLLMVDHAFHLAMSNQDYWKFVPVEEHRNVMGINRFPMRNTGMQGNMGQTDVFLEALESNGEISDCETKFPIKMIVFYSNNVIANMAAEAPRILQALDNTEFNISVDPFMTPTAMASCELVVPIAMSCERNSLRAWWWPLRSISKVVDRYFETKTDEEFCAELTKRLNPDSPVPETDIGWMNQILSNSDIDITFEELEKKVIVWPEWKYKKYETGDVRYDGLPGFNTVTGRFEFTPVLFGQIGLPKAPYYTEPPESPTSTPDLYSEYPLILMTGRRSWEFFHSENRNQATMREFHPDPIIEISPELAAEQDFNEGDWVWIENQRGRCRQRVRITAGLRKDYVMAEHGWWYPEADPERLYETFDMNINNLTSQCDCGASGYGAPYNGLLCRVYKCSEENSKVMPTDQILKLGGWDYVRKHIDFSGLAVMQTAKPEHGAADNTVVGDTATLIGGWDK
jgi:anaerobic selenocysteine-containing dehydrogenase